MSDFYARQIIEALRSGVPSRAAGEYFSEARPEMRKRITARLEQVRETGVSDGMIYTGRYGEGKTHLLQSVFGLAGTSNMAVSYISLGKETPLNRPELLYGKLIANTFLPGARQPGFMARLSEALTPGSGMTGELLAYAAKELDTDRLYYLLAGLVGTGEEEERAILTADLEGDFTTDAVIKRIYRGVSGKPARLQQSFSKRKHVFDYFRFMSRTFRALGCDGWVLLFDELELIGRLGKTARAKAYAQMQRFLGADERMESVFSLFALSSSYVEDVIEKKNDRQNVQEIYAGDEAALRAAEQTIRDIVRAPELTPLTKNDIAGVLLKIQALHGKAYGWTPRISADTLLDEISGSGYLLRTKIRAAIEFLDQLYLYGSAGETRITQLGTESYDEDVPDLSGDGPANAE